VLALAPASANVVPFRQSAPSEPKVGPALSPVERRAFRELAQELTARLRGPEEAPLTVAENAEALPAEALEARAAEPAIEQVLLDRIRWEFWSIGMTSCSTPTVTSWNAAAYDTLAAIEQPAA